MSKEPAALKTPSSDEIAAHDYWLKYMEYPEMPIRQAHLAGQQHERERIWAAIRSLGSTSILYQYSAQLSAIIFEGQEFGGQLPPEPVEGK